MHPYATDSHERKTVIYYLVLLSVIVAIGLNYLLNRYKVSLPFTIAAPSLAAFFGFFYATFNKYIWKISLLQKIGIVNVPNLSGSWSGYLQSSFDELKEKRPITVTIKQSWTYISVKLTANSSTSFSLAASVLIDVPDGPNLIYFYQNEPQPIAEGTMTIHKGTNIFKLASQDHIEGEYYTGRGRMTFGLIYLDRNKINLNN
mgnify:CR=1 FL=1